MVAGGGTINKFKLCIVTANRAEYGLLHGLILKAMRMPELDVRVAVTGAHLEDRYGSTYKEILNDNIPIDIKIPIQEQGDSPVAISNTMSNAIRGFATYFSNNKPDMVLVLGDRYETMAVCIVAMNEQIPIAHIHGGELTLGAIDDAIRHSITKMSYLHFASREEYRNRIIQLGEYPDRVYNVGSLGIDNIINTKLLEKRKLYEELGIEDNKDYAVVTFHPTTLDVDGIPRQINAMCQAMSQTEGLNYIITGVNSDAGNITIRNMWNDYINNYSNAYMYDSLGVTKYLSAVKYARFVLGNSSSGILEVPYLGVPTVNVGDRQKGRIRENSVIDCECDTEAILEAISRAMNMQSDGNNMTVCNQDNIKRKSASDRILEHILAYSTKKCDYKKGFYDII